MIHLWTSPFGGSCKGGVANVLSSERSKGLPPTPSLPPFSPNKSFRPQGTYNAFAADVWAAGVCLWVFRFGTPPFYDVDPSNLFVDICRQPLLFPENADEGDEVVLAATAVELAEAARLKAAEIDKVHAEEGARVSKLLKGGQDGKWGGEGGRGENQVSRGIVRLGG